MAIPSAPKVPLHIPSLDGMRAVSIALVIFAHAASTRLAPAFLDRFAPVASGHPQPPTTRSFSQEFGQTKAKIRRIHGNFLCRNKSIPAVWQRLRPVCRHIPGSKTPEIYR